MIIMESAIAMNNDYVECGNTLGKIMLFAEASYKEYEINLKEVALKVLKENGTEDDFAFLATEAATGYIDRVKKAIGKLIDTIVSFVRNCKEKLIKLLTNEKTNKAIDKAEEFCDENPKLRSMKVEYQNTDKKAGAIQQGIDRIRKKTAKIKAKGIATQSDIDEIDEIESSTMKKVAAISIVSVATLGAVIALFKKCNSRTEIEDACDENKIVNGCDPGNLNSDNTKDATTANFFVKSTGALVHLSKELVTLTVAKSTSIISKIKETLGKASGKVLSENLEAQVNESVLEDLPMFECIKESVESTDTITDEAPVTDTTAEVTEEVQAESAGIVEGLDLDNYFTELCDELFTANVTDNVTESATETTEEVAEEVEPVANTDTADVVEENVSEEEVQAEEGTAEETTVETESPVETENSNETTTVENAESNETDVSNDNEVTVEDVVEENADTVVEDSNANDQFDIDVYMEQLEAELFNDNETVVEENATNEESNDSDTIQNLLDEMEALL